MLQRLAEALTCERKRRTAEPKARCDLADEARVNHIILWLLRNFAASALAERPRETGTRAQVLQLGGDVYSAVMDSG